MSSKHQDYTIGFMFDVNTGHVALICKNRPAWQAGKLNGIGGHVELGERPEVCQAREFQEETGVLTSPDDWHLYCTLQGTSNGGKTYRVYCYWAMGDLTLLHTVTDEQVVTLDPRFYDHELVLDNVTWLIPMAAFDGQQHHYLETMVNRRTACITR
jgi:8-oxo-dGTP diphosphatase